MNDADAALKLEAILIAENAALERHDAETATRLLGEKLAASRALTGETVSPELGARLRDLVERNKELLERAIGIQQQIVAMVVRAAQAGPSNPRYGAAGRTLPAEGRIAMTRQA